MKKISMLAAVVAIAVVMAACGGKYGAGVPEKYVPLLDDAIARAGDNADDLLNSLRDTPEEQREGMAYLIAYMPQSDLDTLSSALLLDNVAYAYRAREEFAWTKALPDSIFLNEVLPYANVDESREMWRAKFYDMFAPKVAGAADLREAIVAVNRGFNVATGVEYNTLREKTNQNPSESMRQGMASCTGLSILLIDALRSVGIPARFAGTANWHDSRGNHSWVEVWMDGKWYFTEFYFNDLDKAWFLPDAGQATAGDREHGIFAVSYKPTGEMFPVSWSEGENEINGTEVSQRYIDIFNAVTEQQAAAGTHVPVKFRMFAGRRSTANSADRVDTNVDVFKGDEQMAGGRTAGPHADMNDVLTFSLEKNNTYTFRYADTAGNPAVVTAIVGEEPVEVTGYME